MEPNSGALTKQIAASIEDVQALLASNQSLSVAFLYRRLRDLEEEVRKRFREIQCPCEAVTSATAAITKLEQRLSQAGVKFKEMQEELDKLKADGNGPPRGVKPQHKEHER